MQIKNLNDKLIMTQSERIYRQFAKQYNYEYYVNEKVADLFFWKKGTFRNGRDNFENYEISSHSLEDSFEKAFALVDICS